MICIGRLVFLALGTEVCPKQELGSGATKIYRPVMKLKIRPLAPNLWPALEDLFGEDGACDGCWWMYWRIGNAYRKNPRDTNKATFHEVVKRGPAPV